MGMAMVTGAAVKQPRVDCNGTERCRQSLKVRRAGWCSPVGQLSQVGLTLLASLCAGAVFAQDTGSFDGGGLGSLAGSASGGASSGASGTPSSGGLRVTSRLGVTQTWTDNNTLSSSNKDAALITLVTPGISVLSTVGPIKGSLDYSLNSVLYVKSSAANRAQQNLAAQGSTELIKNFLSLDAQASIAQQVASAFGQQTIDNSLSNPNRTEVATVSMSPHVKGRLFGWTAYDARASFVETNAKGSITGDSRNQSASLRFDGLGSGPLNWWTMSSGQQSSFKSGSKNMSAMARVGLNYRPEPDLSFGINAGRERNDYLSTGLVGSNNGKTNSSTAGLNASWSLSPRTKLAADWQSHEYGDAHTFNFDHRMARSSFRLLSSQSVSLGNGSNVGGLNSNYDLYFLQFASLEPDLLKRDLLVRNTLLSLGLNPNAVATSGFLTSSPSLQERQEGSFTWQGLRTTLTTTASRSSTSRLGATAGSGDLAASGRIIQRGLTFSLTQRLTPISNATLTVSQTESQGDLATQTTTLKAITANWSSRLGLRTSIAVGARFTEFVSLTSYRERAVFANLVQQF
jgi:uncharacterized protein (PEP-CTERM system associated)